jgi:hypothetical protein
MKNSVDGRLLDTRDAEAIADFSYAPEGDPDYQKETLYRHQDGSFFLAGVGGADSYYAQLFAGKYVAGADFIPLTPDEARRWLEDQGLTDVITQVFGTSEWQPDRKTVSVQLSTATKESAERAAAKAGVPLAVWVERVIVGGLSEDKADGS